MKALLFILIAFVLVLLTVLFIKNKQNSLISTLFSFTILTVFGFAAIFWGIRETDNIKTIEIARASAIKGKEPSIIQIEEKVLIDAPVIEQFPELPRGCEVTSLAMLLESAGIKTDKMKLAEEVRKDPAKRSFKNGQIHFGNPNKGFVGNMYTFNEPGLGVYHEPIMELAEKYLPGKIVNLSNQSFDELKIPLSDARPVWVIINSQYKELDDSYFQTWHTKEGKIRITMKEHSVLITGYDKDYVYFNDPLTGLKNKKAPIKDFEKSWVQMGSHALTYSLD
ncbi:C39 family peptidase [Bacillus sp. FSL K6-3431]|uniref:C39 family peptidase n=1 Tax=Bacillus sp. FSL K6-3431 TaxID=2921500 RepID=UPI0030F6C6E3